ncbi:amidohydrolase family protein [Shewanella nanhaiensis]|uniref:Amidohydrolase family protein n=1 Tax=Shewanella nanhaiensis TaxID=2864872 RepID=A0ABS7E345_9GAMM|nr:amidohydrolase family protein [Shewanella nanhaiensis]MBW8184100.1 amidohydrolase family protein [Shewanella nanhaiensis]
MLKTISKWFLVIFAFLILVTITFLIWYKSAINSTYGFDTELVDHTAFATPLKLTAITNTNVLSPDGQTMLPNRTVIVDDGKILSVIANGTVPTNAEVIDGNGKYVIPGLVDSHIHIHKSPNDLLLYVANGVTHIRDLGGFEENLQLRDEIEQGRVGPRMFVSSPPLNTKDFIEGTLFEFFTFHKTARNVEQAEEMVKEFIEQGYDAIKTYHLDMPSYRAVNKLAAEQGTPTVGHFPLTFELSELKITQQRELAHIEEIVTVLIREFGSINKNGSDAFYAHVEARSDEIIDDILAKDITVNSVLLYMENIHDQFSDLESKLKSVPVEYVNPALVEGTKLIPGYKVGWLPGSNQFEAVSAPSTKDYKEYDIYWTAREKAHHILLKSMIEREVKIVAGSDSGGFLVVPGFALHKEIRSLNLGGMSPAQTLATATRNPAELMNSNAGIVEAGKRADLVLLNKNPLVNIENTRSIDTVILNGRVFGRAKLDAMLEAVKQANNNSRKVNIDKYL